MKTKFLFTYFICGLLIFVSCKKSKQKTEEPEPTFDKSALLTNLADNVILPNYQSFSYSLDSLVTAYNIFNNTNSISDFQIVKQKFNTTYLKYQQISINEFGPAEQQMVRLSCNIFPTDTVQINSNIASGSSDLTLVANQDAKGFPALDYLFYDLNKSESQVVQSFIDLPNKKTYVSSILTELQTIKANIIAEWNSSYRNQFINSLGADIGSSIGLLVNQINAELDYLKNAKIGIPLGKKSLNIALPNNCEALYNSQSVSYAIATLNSIENSYLGRSVNGSDGIGFDDYLDALDAKSSSGSLNTAIKNQFSIAKSKLVSITGSLSSEVVANPSTVNAAYTELVKLLVLLKTDMPSNLGVVITYQDGDGD